MEKSNRKTIDIFLRGFDYGFYRRASVSKTLTWGIGGKLKIISGR